MDRFICPQCQAEYTVTRSGAPADREPTCERCDRRFPDEKDDGWLHYARVDTQRKAMQGAVTA
jgi:transposase-like protein